MGDLLAGDLTIAGDSLMGDLLAGYSTTAGDSLMGDLFAGDSTTTGDSVASNDAATDNGAKLGDSSGTGNISTLNQGNGDGCACFASNDSPCGTLALLLLVAARGLLRNRRR